MKRIPRSETTPYIYDYLVHDQDGTAGQGREDHLSTNGASLNFPHGGGQGSIYASLSPYVRTLISGLPKPKFKKQSNNILEDNIKVLMTLGLEKIS